MKGDVTGYKGVGSYAVENSDIGFTLFGGGYNSSTDQSNDNM